MNIQKMMQEAQKIQNALKKKNAEFMQTVFEYNFKDYVKISIKGNLEIQSIEINKDIVDPEDVPMINDIIQEAMNNAISETNKKRDQMTSEVMPQGMMDGFGGLF